jgi:tetratricopeptide (TPR) repeat protein
MLAMQVHDPQRAQSLARRACEMHEAQSYDWLLRLEAGIAANDATDTVLASKVVAERWPELLPQSLQGLENSPDAVRYQVLAGLANFSMPHEPPMASNWWRDLALLQLERGERTAAVATLKRVANAYVAVSIEADRRFDPVRHEAHLDVEDVAQHAIDAAAKRAQANPDKLQPLNELAGLLAESLLLPQVLQVADAAIEQVSKWGESAYTDYDPEYSELLDQRAQVLAGMGRWDAAVIQLQAASVLPENASANVSQVIDLAALYNDLGRAPQARASLAKLRPDTTSAVGMMQFQKETLRAALALGDTAGAQAALQFMEAHRTDALDVYQEALLDADRQEAGAALLIQRLANPRTRSAALLAVQVYTAVSLTEVQEEKLRRWQELLGRSDVKDAIERVGRIGTYRLAADNYY